MANTKSAKKNILINARNRARNLHFKTRMRTAIKNARAAIVTKDKTAATVTKETLRIIDKTVSKGVIKKQTAARLKSNLAVFLNKSLSGKPDINTAEKSKKVRSVESAPKKAKKVVEKAAK